jgi:outer membrane protein assembly factor BamB
MREWLTSRAARRSAVRVIAGSAGVAVICGMAWGAGSAAAAGSRPLTPAAQDWTAYLNGPLHWSYSPAEKTITPANAADLVQKWQALPGTEFLASPTVYDGAVYIGSAAGWFYKLSVATGRILDKQFLGYQPRKTCGPVGIVSTATVAASPKTGEPTVYVASASGYLYALSASNLSLDWKSVVAIPSTKVSNYFTWSSPTIANGKIYIGVSSNCDNPLIPGGVIGYDQATGKRFARFYSVPAGDIGGSVWSSVAVAPDGDVFASTGNGPEGSAKSQLLGYSESIVKLAPDTLKVLGRFQVPATQLEYDNDFGASPLIIGNSYVGACDKNGYFYMLSQATMKVRWEQRLAVPVGTVHGSCIASPAYNGTSLYLGGGATTIKKVAYGGSVQERQASNGKLVWETGLPNRVVGSPTLDGAGVLAVPTYGSSTVTPNEMYLVSAESGVILDDLIQGYDFAQGVFAESLLFTANTDGVYAWEPKPAS